MGTVFFSLVFLAMGGRLVAQVNEPKEAPSCSVEGFSQHSYDVRYTAHDDLENGFTGHDLYGLRGNKTEFDQATGLRICYSFMPGFLVDASGAIGKMSGANELEYYRSKVNFVMLGARYTFNPSERWAPFVRVALGAAGFRATRFFVSDDVAFSREKGMTFSSEAGAGLRYRIDQHWSILGDVAWNVVATDAWDGYDYHTGSDELLRSSFGLCYTFIQRSKGAACTKNPVSQVLDRMVESIICGTRR